ncbi:MAG: hypothetical protein IJX05_01005 [Clostridia bacterium]|nr:hypothetical protein [Clostridia bacterium]
MKKYNFRLSKKTLHNLRYGRVAVLPEDPTKSVNYIGNEDEDRKYD